MEDEKEIKELAEKFMSGETTLIEEERLYSYFAEKNISADLLPMKELFLGFGAIRNNAEKLSKKKLSHVAFLRRTKIGVAASIALLIASAITINIHNERNYCEAYIYNRHVTDQDVVMKEVTGTLEMIHGDDQMVVDNQLRGIFSNIQ